MNLADAADAQVDRINTPRPSTRVQTWKVLIELGDTWSELEIVGSASEAVEEMEQSIDMIRGRWARGHGNTCIAASDGVSEETWYKVFGKKPASKS